MHIEQKKSTKKESLFCYIFIVHSNKYKKRTFCLPKYAFYTDSLFIILFYQIIFRLEYLYTQNLFLRPQ